MKHKVTITRCGEKAYDGFESTRLKLGVKGQAVIGMLKTETMSRLRMTLTTLESAKAFAGANELKAAEMKCRCRRGTHHPDTDHT